MYLMQKETIGHYNLNLLFIVLLRFEFIKGMNTVLYRLLRLVYFNLAERKEGHVFGNYTLPKAMILTTEIDDVAFTGEGPITFQLQFTKAKLNDLQSNDNEFQKLMHMFSLLDKDSSLHKKANDMHK